MRIGVLAPPWISVPPDTYGGTELIADILCRGFKAEGHEVVLFASGDSTCPVTRISEAGHSGLPPDKYREHLQVAGLLRRARSLGLDIIHSHLEAIQPYAPLLDIPVVCTLHVDVDENRKAFIGRNEKVTYVAVSENQARTFPVRARVIHHGIELHRYPLRRNKEPYFAFLGEISRKKGTDVAVSAWMALAATVKIAGYVPPSETDWFKKAVMGRLQSGGLEFLGPVDFRAKIDLLGNARAVLCPIRWEEPFGLVPIEAMACGTPVIARRRAAFGELIDDGVTGFLCEDDDDILSAAARADSIDPDKCRGRVEALFDSRRMVADYLALFRELLGAR